MELTYDEEGTPIIKFDGANLLTPLMLRTYAELVMMAHRMSGNGHHSVHPARAYEIAHEIELWQLKHNGKATMPE